jgi:hypothetical protein
MWVIEIEKWKTIKTEFILPVFLIFIKFDKV